MTQAQILESFLIPDENDYDPFVFHSENLVTSVGVEAEYGKITTKNKWLRIYSYELMHGHNSNNRLMFIGNGFGDYNNFIPAGMSGYGIGKNIPIFALIPPRTTINFRILPGVGQAFSALRVNGFYFNWNNGSRPIFRKFLAPYFKAARVLSGAGKQLVISYPGGKDGMLCLDNFRLRCGTVNPNNDLIETDCECLFDLNGIFGNNEAGWCIPIYGETPAKNPFNIYYTPNAPQEFRASLSGYYGGEFIPDDIGMFAPTKRSVPFCKSFSASQSGSSGGLVVRTRLAQIQVPQCNFARIYLLWANFSVNTTSQTTALALEGNGLSEYSYIPPSQGNFGNDSLAIPLMGKVPGGSIIEIYGYKTNIGATTVAGSLYGWLNG